MLLFLFATSISVCPPLGDLHAVLTSGFCTERIYHQASNEFTVSEATTYCAPFHPITNVCDTKQVTLVVTSCHDQYQICENVRFNTNPTVHPHSIAVD